jgi:hypothetical protein
VKWLQYIRKLPEADLHNIQCPAQERKQGIGNKRQLTKPATISGAGASI